MISLYYLNTESKLMTSTATAHTNIAFIKYWGKKDTLFNLPTTSSISLTLNEFYTKTSVTQSGETDQLIINDTPADSRRIHHFLNILRENLGDFPALTVNSHNHVPTSAGLASSASAFASLTAAVTKDIGADLSLSQLSRLARRGSGSASRSFYDHFAIWHEGIDDQSSFAESLNAPANLPIALVVAEISSSAKKIGSTEGMNRAMTSPNYGTWVKNSADQLIDMKRAIENVDIEKIGAIAEANALSMHALNLTAKRQPFTYFTSETQQVLALVRRLRKQGILAFATLDAGPNVKIITHLESAQQIIKELNITMPDISAKIATSGPGISYD